MMALSHLQKAFGDKLLDWHWENPRPLPWKETKDPYRIWLSEIILQQTQVSQGIPYYERFVDAYPTVADLAAASEEEVLKLWQGLGYNSRARNLHKAAVTVAEELGGYFPKSSPELRKLSGIGPYTAAAIASFAFGEQVPVVDTNVIRIVCRMLAIDELPSRKRVRQRIEEFLDGAMAGYDPAEFNQAIMNFGALQCTPKSPDCTQCPMQDMCQAYQHGIVADLPVKPVKRPRRERYFHYLVIHNDEGMVLRKRMADDIWKGMYDFPLIETEVPGMLSPERIANTPVMSSLAEKTSYRLLKGSVHTDSQILSHQKIHCLFYPIFADDIGPVSNSFENHVIAAHREVSAYAVPKVVDCYFRVKSIFL